MEQIDALVYIAELALGIAGFSGVVVALGTRPGVWPMVDRLRLATLLVSGLGALFLVLIAMMLLMLNIGDTFVWRISSCLMALLLLVMLTTIVPRAWSITRETTGMKSAYSVAVFIPSVIVGVVTALFQSANAIGSFENDAFGILFGGLVVLLIVSGTQFVRLLFMVRGVEEGEIRSPNVDA